MNEEAIALIGVQRHKKKHVSSTHVPIIRRKLLYFCDTDICHSGRRYRREINKYRVTQKTGNFEKLNKN